MIEFIVRPIDRWPQEVTRHRKRAAFRVQYARTLQFLSRELELIGVRRAYIQADVQEYRAAAKKAHPDAGGSTDEWSRLQLAAAILRDYHQKPPQ